MCTHKARLVVGPMDLCSRHTTHAQHAGDDAVTCVVQRCPPSLARQHCGVRFKKEGRKEMFYLMMHSAHFIYGYMASEQGRKEMFYLTTHSAHYIYGYMASEQGRKEMFYLTTHSTHFIYGYMASDIW